MEIVHQLRELFLQAVPTVLIVFLFYLFLRANFFRPVQRVLDERQERTIGARRAAEGSQAAAAERIRAYQAALKKARAEVYAEQEAARHKILEERSARLRESRSRAAEQVRAAKKLIAEEVARSRMALEAESGLLGSEIANAILGRPSPSSSGPVAMGGAR